MGSAVACFRLIRLVWGCCFVRLTISYRGQVPAFYMVQKCWPVHLMTDRPREISLIFPLFFFWGSGFWMLHQLLLAVCMSICMASDCFSLFAGVAFNKWKLLVKPSTWCQALFAVWALFPRRSNLGVQVRSFFLLPQFSWPDLVNGNAVFHGVDIATWAHTHIKCPNSLCIASCWTCQILVIVAGWPPCPTPAAWLV